MKNTGQYAALLAERARNEKTILKLTRRNREIDRVAKTVSSLATGKVKDYRATPSPTMADPDSKQRETRVVQFPGIMDRVLEGLSDGKPRHCKELSLELYGHEGATQSVAKACSHWVKQGKLVRVDFGTYRRKGGAVSKKTTTKVGHDTRVTQVPKKK